MDDIEELKAEIEKNNKRIELMAMKKKQDKQLNDLEGKEGSNVITKKVAAQEIITYLSKVKPWLYAIFGVGIVGFSGILYAPIIMPITLIIISLLCFITIFRIQQSFKYLYVNYKLPGWEKFDKKNVDPKETAQKLNNFFGN